MLVVEDDSAVRNMLIDSFTREGHRVLGVADGASAVDYATTDRFDVLILDVALGEGPDGYEVCRVLRERRNVVPVIMLTALDSEADAVLGLEAGADDYVTKPFGLAELRSRIRAVLRRSGGNVYTEDVFSAGRVRLDRRRREVTAGNEQVDLTFSEFELLSTLIAILVKCSTGSSCCARSGVTAPIATHAASTCTSGTCARSSRTRRSTQP